MAFSVSVSATESEVNVANNTSKLTVSLTLNSTYGSWFGDTKYGTIVIDGTSYGISYNFPSGTTSKNIGSASKVITHNSSTGAYTANWSYSVPTNSSQGTKTGSGSTTLTTIARASEPSLSATSVNLNTKVTINTNYKNTSFRHTITYSIGNASGRIGNDKGVADKVDWTPPYSLADQFTNATSGNVTITCQTYNGNTLVGTKTCTLQVKTVDTTEFKPTIGLSASYTGKFNNNYLLNGISGITVSATTGFKHRATLSSYTISGASKSSTKAALSLSPINVSMTSATTTLTFSGTITDSRGYTNTASNLTATVYRYNKPQIKSCNVYRCSSSTSSTPSSSGTYAAVVITYTYQNDGYSNSMSTKQININGTPYPLTTTETTSNGVVTGTGTTIVGDGHLLITTSYPYTVTCKDAVNQTTTVTGSLPTADRIWDVRPQGKGLSVGKFAEHDNMVESAWEIKAPSLNITGEISEGGTSLKNKYASASIDSALVGQSSSTTTKPWYKFASCSVSDSYQDRSITFKVSACFADASKKTGILTAHFRTNGNSYWESGELFWEYASSGINASDFVLAHNASSKPTIAELWVKQATAYQIYHFDVLTTGTRDNSYKRSNNNGWTLYTTKTAGSQSAITSGYTQVISTIGVAETKITTTESLAYWSVDGYPVYCKKINFGAAPNNNIKNVNTGLTNSSVMIVRVDGWAYRSSTQTWFPVGGARSDTTTALTYYLDNGVVTVQTQIDRSNCNLWFYIYYIKKTPG